MPVPSRGEEAADGAKSTEALDAVGREYVLHVVDIALENVDAVACTCGETLKEAVLYLDGLVVGEERGEAYAHLHLGGEHQLGLHGVLGVGVGDVYGAQSEAVAAGLGVFELLVQPGHDVLKLVPCLNPGAVEGDDAVAFGYSCLLRGRAFLGECHL